MEELEEFSGDITNPTSIAFDRSGRMFVTSRFDGTVYRMTPLKEVVVFASDLGIATGLAFNREGEMFVGDRSGAIYRVNEIGEAQALGATGTIRIGVSPGFWTGRSLFM